MRHNQKKRLSSLQRSRRALIISLILLVVAAGAIGTYWYKNRNNATDSKATAARQENNEPEPPKKTSEGQTFPVPSDVPADAIKDYVLIKETDEYKIRQLGATNKYTITLYAIINNPDQYDMYRDQLKEYKQKALDYLRSQGVDVNTIEVTYEPDEAKDL